MGYRSDVRGEMTFSRPLRRGEAARMETALEDQWSIWKLTENVDEETDEEEGTTIIRRSFTGLELCYEGSEVKCIGYGWDGTLQKIINALPEDVTVSGLFEAWGEGSWAYWSAERLYVRGRIVILHSADISWPPAPEGVQG